jgi:uncharacterized protein
MSIIDQLKKDIHQSIIDKNASVSDSLRYLLSLIQKEQSKSTGEFSDKQVVEILTKELKHKKEAEKMFTDGERSDLAKKEAEEIILLEKYLPDQASEKEIRQIVSGVVSELGGDNFGKVMGAVMAKLKGRADGSMVQKIVTEELS